MKKYLPLVVAFVCAGVVSAGVVSAQDVPPLAHVTMMKTMQQQVDKLQERMDGPGEKYMRATIDYVQQGGPRTASIQGWAFACGAAEDRLVLFVDGIATVQTGVSAYLRIPRADVGAAYDAFCAGLVPTSYVPHQTAGFHTLIDLAPFGAGPRNDGEHEFQIRIYDTWGRMVRSNTVTKVVW